MPQVEIPPVAAQQPPNQAAIDAQPTLMERAVNKTVDVVTSPHVQARVVAIGHDTLEGMGITNVDKAGGRHLNVDVAIGHLQNPRPAFRHFGREFGKAAAGEAAAHAGKRVVGHMFERFPAKHV